MKKIEQNHLTENEWAWVEFLRLLSKDKVWSLLGGRCASLAGVERFVPGLFRWKGWTIGLLQGRTWKRSAFTRQPQNSWSALTTDTGATQTLSPVNDQTDLRKS